MKKMKYILILVNIIIGSLTLTGDICACAISDKEAIALSKNFCSKMSVTCLGEPWVRSTEPFGLVNDLEFKDVEIGEQRDHKISFQICCNHKEVIGFYNWELERQVRKKYKISSVTWEPHNWPRFLSEKKAKEIILSIAKKIGLPRDMEFAQLRLDKEKGIWSGHWIRKHNGFEYEEESVGIDIMAVDGEFYTYGKRYVGKPCPTEVKVSKEEAIKEGWEQIARLFSQVNWKKYKKDYEIKSAELKIVQPNTLAGKIVPRYSRESRLAWVIVYGLKTQPDPNKLRTINYLRGIDIKIDAATMKFLGGDYTQ